MAVTFQKTLLDNGLAIVAEVDPDAHTAACGFFVKTGSRDEDPAIMGVSHFLEHMMFKGTETRTADDVNREFDECGANYNAYTSEEITAFHAHVLPEYFSTALDILADIMRPSLRVEDLDTERGVILEEIAMYDDVPYWRLHEAMMERYYDTHPLSLRVLGTVNTVKAISRDAMQHYFIDRYSADNTTLALAGNLDFNRVVDQIQTSCGNWQKTDTKRTHPPLQPIEKQFEIHDKNVNRHYMIALSPAPAIDDDRRDAASLLANLIGHPESSLLYWALTDPGIADEVQVSYVGRDGLGAFSIFACCDPKRASQVEDIIRDQTKNCIKRIKQDDLDRLKCRIATAFTLHSERPSGRMSRLGREWTYMGSYRPLDEHLEIIQAITLDDIREVYEAFPFTPQTIGRLTPHNSK